ncbi:BQ5605_C003g01950 [Microbotryum silenes-dioicae]|uniref:BQ5605_C003g01950 protein n=1 Tax=Microbotryum silenes-dioicae TaxID=796604 RepID=A0A2X0P2X1_9BASI|nr:BQ5605_C003g01950 [Microbotryum silenes-dioicae]
MLGRKKKRQGSISSVEAFSASGITAGHAGFGHVPTASSSSSNATTAPGPPASWSVRANDHSAGMTPTAAPASSSSTSGGGGSRAFNYFVERARGAVGFGSRERTKSSSSDDTSTFASISTLEPGSVSSPTISSGFNPTAKAPSSTSSASNNPKSSSSLDINSVPLGAAPMSIPYSVSMHEIAPHQSRGAASYGATLTMATTSSSVGASATFNSASFFSRRTSTASNPHAPAWLAPTSASDSRGGASYKLSTSPSSPNLSTPILALSQEQLPAGRRRQGTSSSTGTSADGGSPLLTSSRSTFARSNEDISSRRQSRMWTAEDAPPVPMLARKSTEDFSSSKDTLGVEPTWRVRTTSLAPNAALNSYPSSSNLSTSAPSSRGSRSPSLSPRLGPSDSPVPLPSSSSALNLSRQAAESYSSTNTLASNTTAATSTHVSRSPELGDRRRDSQTIHCQGFLQRKADYVPMPSPSRLSPSGTAPTISSPVATGSGSSQSYFSPRAPSPRLRPTRLGAEVDLQKGWKPYRAILKGSKLYLHKPPADLSSTAKSMFPTTVLDPPSQEPSPRTPAGFEGDASKRRQRAYWGAGGSAHPRLMVADKSATSSSKHKLTGGTVEAITHEVIFATTFPVDEGSPAGVEASESAYDAFLDTLLLFRPYLFGPSGLFATELQRFAALATRTSQESETATPTSKAALEARLAKLIGDACIKYPQDLSATIEGSAEWRAAMDEILKQVRTLSSEESNPKVDELQKLWDQTIEKASSSPPPLTASTEWASPSAASSAPRSGPASLPNSPTKARKRTPESPTPPSPTPDAVMQLTPHSLVQLDPVAFAAQIHAFHLDRLTAINSDPLSTSRLILRHAASGEAPKRPSLLDIFSFSASTPHFLTRVVVNSILAPLTPTAAGPSSVIYMRAAVISQWVAIGEELRRRGDATGWAAVAMGVCCRAVARLDEASRSVGAERIEIVRHTWAPILRSITFSDDDESKISPLAFEPSEKGTAIPYLGSILEKAAAELKASATQMPEQPDATLLLPLYDLHEELRKVDSVWSREPLSVMQVALDPRLQHFLQRNSRLTHPEKPQLSTYLAPSLKAEPRLVAQGINLLVKSRSAQEPSPLVPLVMVEPLPHISLVDRGQILASSRNPALRHKGSYSNMSSNASDSVHPGGTQLARRASYPPHAASASLGLGAFARLRKDMTDPANTLLPFADGDIVFTIVSNAVRTVPSTPTLVQNERGTLSRTSSWIESRSSRGAGSPNRNSTRQSLTPTLAPLSRVPSRGGSPVAVSPPLNEHSPTGPKLQAASEEEPVHVVVRAGTVEAFVDLLVLGISNLRTPSTDADGQSSLTGRRPLQLDAADFRSAFFSTFRSFTTPLVLLDMLRKRYLAAPNASLDHVNLTSERPFPAWSMAPISPGIEVDWAHIASIRVSVLRNISYWMDHHIGDFLDDDELFISATTFLHFIESSERANARPENAQVLAELQKLLNRIGIDLLRPAVKSRAPVVMASATPLSYDELNASQLVDRLDQIACRLTQNLSETDLLRYIEQLEIKVQADPALWYPSCSIKTDEEELVIADSYSLLEAAQNDVAPLRHMPLSLQEVIRAHGVIRKWVLAHLVEPEISLRLRTLRMVKALEMIEISRSRMANVVFGGSVEDQVSVVDPSLAGFVERVVISAVVAPESRLFASAWQAVASTRNVVSADSLLALVRHDLVVTDSTATLDPAWLNERLVEIVSQVDSLSDGVSINFSKRRWIFNIIRNALVIRPSQPAYGSDDPLISIERKVAGWGAWSMRTLRDAASGEGSKSTRSLKPFSRLVAAQQDKVRRERTTKELVLKTQKTEQQQRAAREKEVAKAMDKSVSMRTRRMTALFRGGGSRPSSVNTAASPASTPSIPPSPSPQALRMLKDWMPSSKPYLVLPLSGVEVQPYENGQRSFVFELVTEDGQRSLFQASTAHELRSWLDHFRRCGTEIAFRRATFLAQTALAEEPEEPAAAKSATSTAAVKLPASALFGTPLWEVLQREDSTIPRFMDSALATITERGLLEVGIYRISGENRVIQQIRQSLDRGGDPASLLSKTDVHNVSGLLKLFLREMPEPLIPCDLYEPFIIANAIEDYDERLYAIRDLVWRLPQPNFHLLRRLSEHLDKVTDHEEVNSMHAANLSIIFAPTLLKPTPGPTAFGLSMTNLGKAANIIKSIILQQNWIFGEEVVEEEQEHTPSMQASRELGNEVATPPAFGSGVSADDSPQQPTGLGLYDSSSPNAGDVFGVAEDGMLTSSSRHFLSGHSMAEQNLAGEGRSINDISARERGKTNETETSQGEGEAQYAIIPASSSSYLGDTLKLDFKFEHTVVPPSPHGPVSAATAAQAGRHAE